jgi:nitrate reductase NapE component
MHFLSLPPAKPGRTEPAVASGATTLRRRTRRTFAVFALLAVCMVGAFSLPSLASERHVESSKIPTTTKLKASATKVKVRQLVYFTVTVTPSKAMGMVTIYVKAPGKPYESAGSRTLHDGVVKVEGEAGEPGTYEIKAVYKGFGSYEPSTSNIVTIKVEK